MSVITFTTAAGAAFTMLPLQQNAPAPTLLLLASTGVDTLTIEPYCCVGRLLHARGWNVVSLDIPCHGADCRAGEPAELAGWVVRIGQGEDFVTDFRARVNDTLAHLIAADIADPRRIAAAGTSRGGFLAFHAAAVNQRIRAVAAFSPATDLRALREFTDQQENPLLSRLSLEESVEALADRAVWITIGNADERVDTARVVAFAHALAAGARKHDPAGEMVLRLLPVPGHCSFSAWHDAAAAWLISVCP